MAVIEIVKDVDKLLERADEIDIRKDNAEAREQIINLKHTIKENNLVCLTAPQIGYNARIMCINFKGDIRTFVNPVVGSVEGMMLDREKCGSLGKEYIHPRYNKVMMTYQTPLGAVETRTFVGLAAGAVQYGLDMLDGILLNAVGLELDENWDNATDEERDEVLEMYCESLDLKRKKMNKELDEDPEAKSMLQAVELLTAVKDGKVELQYEKVSDEEAAIIDAKIKAAEKADKEGE